MTDSQFINNSLQKLLKHIEFRDYKGYDPYDALKSPLFRLPLLRSNKSLRFTAQQLVKRLPFNIRPLLAIPKGYNPVTLGLCLQGYLYMAQGTEQRAQTIGTDRRRSQTLTDGGASVSVSGSVHSAQSMGNTGSTKNISDQEQGDYYLDKIKFLISELKNVTSPGYSGACWGYDFPWEARYASIPAYQPNIVATGIITNALFITHKLSGNPDCAELVNSSAQFVLSDLKRTYFGDYFIFSYSPFDHQQVLNASMKAVRILAQAYSVSGDENLRKEAEKAAGFVASRQRSDGSWPYSLASTGDWTDNYHTGYVLECLDEYSRLCGDRQFEDNIRSGYLFYRNNFFTGEGKPRFYVSREWPVDCTPAAQSIITLCRFGDMEMAKKVALYTIRNMQSPEGGFYFRKYCYGTNKTIFMRWSNAWMMAALARLLFEINKI